MEAQNGRSGAAPADAGGRSSLRVSGAAGVVGGLCLTASAIMQSLQPRGCIAEECVGRTYRSAGPLEALLFLAGVVLIVGATLGFLALVSPRSRAARVVRIGAVVAASAMFFGVVLMGFVYFAALVLVLLAVIAYAALGAGLVATRALPAWSGVLLAVSAVLLIVANDQNERILLVIPFAVTWMVLGALLWASAATSLEGHSGRMRLA